METNPDPIKEILGELFSLLETFETQSLALTQFLKDQGIATDEKLAPYLDRAGNASSVKWRAARARMQYLLSPVPKPAGDTEKDKNKDKKAEPEKPSEEKPSEEKPSEEKPSEEKPSEEKPSEEKPSEEKPSEEKPSAEKPSTEKAATEKRAENPPPDQKKPESTDAAKDTARNTNASADKNRKPVAEDDAKKSNTRQKSNRK
jgi:chemotaxis protein histidine kinase CheA